jgi:hypothetical protein
LKELGAYIDCTIWISYEQRDPILTGQLAQAQTKGAPLNRPGIPEDTKP